MLVSLGHARILQAQLGRKHPRIAFALCITLAASFSGSSSYLNITHTSRLPLGWHLPSSAFCVAPPQFVSQFARGSLVLLFNWVFFFCVCFVLFCMRTGFVFFGKLLWLLLLLVWGYVSLQFADVKFHLCQGAWGGKSALAQLKVCAKSILHSLVKTRAHTEVICADTCGVCAIFNKQFPLDNMYHSYVTLPIC